MTSVSPNLAADIGLRPMQPNADFALLRAYVDRNDQAAFGRLVSTHLDLVYAAALRQVRRADWAEEITQVVFVILARKAATFTSDVMLPAWLHRTTRYTSLNWVKVQTRRRKHERRAAEMAETEVNPKQAWSDVGPLLDAAVQSLNPKDREVVLLRFFQQKSVAETGVALGISENAAGMRISRAVEKLRRYFSTRGVALTSLALGLTVAEHSVKAAPPGVHETITHNLFAALSGEPSAAGLIQSAERIERSLFWMRVRLVLAAMLLIAILVALATGTALYLSTYWSPPQMR